MPSWQIRPLESVKDMDGSDLDINIPYPTPGVDIRLRNWSAGFEHAGIINENLYQSRIPEDDTSTSSNVLKASLKSFCTLSLLETSVMTFSTCVLGFVFLMSASTLSRSFPVRAAITMPFAPAAAKA